MKKYILLFLVFLLCGAESLMAQGRRNEKKILTYETLYDAPYEINKLWVQFQPVYTEFFGTNVTAGFGVEASYFWADKMSFHAHFRKPYARQTDYQRNIAYYNSSEIKNERTIFNFFEAGGTYHIKDWEEDTETFIHLYSQRYSRANKWKSMVPEKSKIPSKVRKIIGARAGGMMYKSTFALDRMISEGLTLADAEGNPFPADIENPFSGVSVQGGYVGGSFSWIKNIAIAPDRSYSDLVKDLMLTTYLDFLFAGRIDINDVYLQGNEKPFSTANIEKNHFGFRAGIDGKFNRNLSWAYNGEFGMRPGLKGRGLYALIKISFPVYSTDLDNRVEAFSK